MLGNGLWRLWRLFEHSLKLVVRPFDYTLWGQCIDVFNYGNRSQWCSISIDNIDGIYHQCSESQGGEDFFCFIENLMELLH